MRLPLLRIYIAIFLLVSLSFVSRPISAQDVCVTGNKIVQENCLPGNPASEWDISGAGDENIQGFADGFSYNLGETVPFKIKTDATDYRLDIYRMGYYDGNGARKVATVQPSATLPQSQPTCLFDAASGLVDCGNWAVSASWAIPATGVSGVYFAKLVREDATPGSSHVFFIVRDDADTSDILFQTADTTWQAYNRYGDIYGDQSLYVGNLGAPRNRAFKVSYNRPFTTRAYANEDWVFNAEYPMIRWLERNGYDVSYFSGIDSDRLGVELLDHKIFMSNAHDEYWSAQQRDNVTAARDATPPVNLAFFSGNEIFWKTRWENSIDGANTPYRTLVSYKETHNDADIDPTNVWTGTWRDNRAFNPESATLIPENALTGQLFMVNSGSAAMQVPAEFGALRFWRNTSVATLTTGQTATLANDSVGYEWDEDVVDSYRPAGLIRLSRTTVNGAEVVIPAEYGSQFTTGSATHHLTLYRADSGALVFGAGTIQWAWGLDSNHDRGSAPENADMQQATVNLFADMGVQPQTLQANLTAATQSTDTTPPTATITSPDGLAPVAAGTTVVINGTAADVGGQVGIVEVSTDNGATWQPATGYANWSFNWQPPAEGVYTLLARATDDSANLGANSTPVIVTAGPQSCPCSIWNLTLPSASIPGEGADYELGVKFRSTEAGFITALRFYKYAQNTGTHVGRLWSATGTKLAEVTYTNETASGWQEVILPNPVAIDANTTYIASYSTTIGFYAFGEYYFTTQGANSGPLTALASGIDGTNGVFNEIPGLFPTLSYHDSNYWVDVVFSDDIGPDNTLPTVSSVSPSNNANGVSVNTLITATFSESMDAATLNNNIVVRDAANSVVAGNFVYNNATRTVTFTPNAVLAYSTLYTVTITGGTNGAADLAGNELAADFSWSFTTSAPPPPPPDEGPGGSILVVATTANPFSRYYAEILRTEGLNYFTVTDISLVTPTLLNNYEVVIVGEMALNAAQVAVFSDWVNAGGNLIAMRPDADLAAIAGVNAVGNTLNAIRGYLQVNTAAAPGAGIVSRTMQFHGAADLYTLNGATTIATLFSDATTATTNPAVTLLNVGSNGGQIAMFAYDLAKSIVYTRQGNPDWAGQERDGFAPLRSSDLFFGNAAGDSQPDWVNLDKVAIPQADEQQRLLANMIHTMNLDNMPLPRFWYFPRGERAVVIMTGDDHSNGGTAAQFNWFASESPLNCAVDDWECIRGTSYIYTNTPLSPSDAFNYHNQGFEIALHPLPGCNVWTPASIAADFPNELATWQAKYTLLPAPVTNRTHCIAWADWSTKPEVELANGIRFDTNYYYWPPAWIQDRPGMFTGSGMPMRFAKTDGTIIDVYQATTQLTDESGQNIPVHIAALLDKALGSEGYYGAFTANMHTDRQVHTEAQAIVAAAKARGVPVITARQMLTWLDGRNASSFENMTWNGTTLTFEIAIGSGANGLRTLLPMQSATGSLIGITLGSNPVVYDVEVIKGVSYAAFNVQAGTYQASYGADTTPPTIINRVPAANAIDVALNANIEVQFSESMDAATITNTTITLRADGAGSDVPAAVSYGAGTNTATLNPTADLATNTVYTVTVQGSVSDAANNPLGANDTWTFTTTNGDACPCTIFNNSSQASANPPIDPSSGEYGFRFRSSQDGFISGVRFYKHANNLGPHVGRLYTNTGGLLAEVTFPNVGSAAGWQEAFFASPVAITANTTYVASYFTPTGNYAFTNGFFQNATTNGALTALADGTDGANGVYQYSAVPAFPTNTFGKSHYWVDVVFVTSLPGDTTPPTIINRVPVANAVDVALDANIEVQFSESMDAATITNTTITLRADGAGSDVPAAVSYVTGTNTAILNPTADLTLNTVYTVTVQGSVSDAANNPLGANDTWTFTTIAGDACPCTVWEDTDVPINPNGFDGQPLELGVKFQSNLNGYVTGLRFYKGSLNTGGNIGHLWTANGDLLAEATFVNETASGWQTVLLSNPVSITANTTYIVSYFSPSGYFAISPGGLNSGVNNPPLRALAHNEQGPNGVFFYGGSGFPTSNGGGSNYHVDVVFVTTLPADTTPPVISGVTATNITQISATIQWNTNENADSLVEYGTDANNLNQSLNAAALVTAHSLNLTGLLPNTTYYYRVSSEDANNNAASEPTGTPLSFTTLAPPPPSVGDTTVADFNAGTPGQCVVTNTVGDGAVMLGAGLNETFDGVTLPVGWSDFSWTGGTSTVGGGLVTADGSRAATDVYYTPGRTLEFVATFNAETFQHVGFGQLLAEIVGESWAVFSTGGTNNVLQARLNNNGTTSETPIPGSWFGSPHLYRIEWAATEIRFYIDNALVHTANVSIGATMRPVISDYQVGGTSVVVDWLKLSPPYATPCTFASQVFDAGNLVTWGKINWQAQTPANSGLVIEVRTGNTPTPDGTWSNFAAVTNGQTLGINSRYIQYRAILSNTNADVTPILESVTIEYNIVPSTPPVAVADNTSTNEDIILNGSSVLANDSDINNDSLTAILVTSVSNGSLTLNANGTFSYTPNANFNGTDSFTYKANDGTADSNIVTVTINVNPVNDVPAAVADAYTTDENVPLIVPASGVLGNDSDVDNASLTAILVDTVAQGTLTFNSNGSFTYTPVANFNGTDSFTYQANDGTANSNIVTVTLTINSVNAVPVAVNDSYSTNEDVALNGSSVLANDSDGENEPLTAILVNNVTKGTLILNTDGTFTYTPNANFNGTDSFTYQANDGTDDSNTATVTITVGAVDDVPVANADSYTVNEDGELNIAAPGILDNDTDTENASLTASLVDDVTSGTLVFNADGSFDYTPNAHFNGTDSFSYQVSDGVLTSDLAIVTITVNAVNDVPVAVNDAYSTNEDTPLTIVAPGLLTNDSDIDSTTLTAVLVNNGANGVVNLSANGGFVYTPNANFNGTDSFTYQANDGTDDSNIATVTITVTPVNDAPVASNDIYSVNEDSLLDIAAPGVIANDTDVDGNPLTATLLNTVSSGTLNFNANGAFIYTPVANFNGSVSFTYQVSDGTLDSNVATVTINVVAVNDAPIADADSYITDEDTPLNVPADGVLDGDSDIENSALTAVLVNNATNGVVSLNANGGFTYTPNLNFNGTDSFTYTANDGTDDSNVATVTITVNPVNDAPTAANTLVSTNEDTPLIIVVASYGSDVDGNLLTVATIGTPTFGSLTANPNGTYTYTPNANFAGADSFTYTVTDSLLMSNTATISISVVAVNDIPVATNNAYSTDEDTPLVVAVGDSILGDDSDVESATLTANLVTGTANGTLNLNADGSVSYTPNANFNGTDSFTYTAFDGTDNSNIATVTITVNPLNDAPVAVADSYNTNEDTQLIIPALGVLGNDSDVDGTPLTAALVTNVANGALTLNSDGSFGYIPTANFNGSDSFTYKANDGTLDSDVVTVSITINPVNDAPVADSDTYSMDEDTVLIVLAMDGVLNGDTDVENSLLTATKLSDPSNGTVTFNGDGSFTYQPNPGFFGQDSFTYKANDGSSDSNVATVTIVIGGVNDEPTASPENYTTGEDVPLMIAAPGVLANDTDIDGDILTPILMGTPTNGSVTLNTDGSFIFTPSLNFAGSAGFSYKVNDGTLDSNVTTVSILVTPINDAPIADSDTYEVAEDGVLTVNVVNGVLNGDTDADLNPLTAILVTNTNHGTLNLSSDGSFTYTPNANFFGTDSFTYKANDGSADSNIATVTITVTGVNDEPVANTDSYAINEDTTLTIAASGVLGNDTDADGDLLTAILVNNAANGTVTLNANGSFAYMPNANFNGTDSFTYKANDGSVDTSITTVTIMVNAVPDAPVLAPIGNRNVAEGATLEISISASDGDDDTLTFSAIDLPVFAALTPTGNNTATLFLSPGFDAAGSYPVTIKVSDGATEDEETFNIIVGGTNRNPILNAIGNQTVAENAVLNVPISASDADNDTLIISALNLPAFATLTPTGNGTATLALTPGFNDSNSYSVTITASDGDLMDSETFNITVTNVNRAPVADNDAYVIAEDGELTIAAPGVLGNDNDADGTTLTAVIVNSVANGTLTLNNDGSFVYAPATGFNGSDSFTYKANDGSIDSNVATVTITIDSVNDAPVANNDSYSTNEDTSLTVPAAGILDNDNDTDGNALTAVLVNDVTNGTLTLNANGGFMYVPNANFNGSDNFTYKANDGSADSNIATVTITVDAINDEPVLATIANQSVDEGQTLTITLSATDIDSAALTFSATGLPSFANLVNNNNGTATITVTPGQNDQGVYNLTAAVSDGNLSDSQPFTLTVTDVLSGGLLGRYFNNRTLTGTPALVRTDSTVNFNWGSTSPAPQVNRDNFSVRWSGQVQPQFSETYYFYTVSDDGVRLWVDGEKIIDNWTDHSAKEDKSVAVVLQAGQKYDIVMDYYERSGLAVSRLLWSSNSQPKQVIPQNRLFALELNPPVITGGLIGHYYNNRTFSSSPTLVRTDYIVDFKWGGNSPAPQINKDNFSVRWTGQVEPLYSETYHFYTISDDGVRLWVNGQIIIDNWTDHPAKEDKSYPIALQAGQKYNIVLEYYERTGIAQSQLLWSSPSQPKQIISWKRLFPLELPAPVITGGLKGRYFNNITLSGSPALTQVDATINFGWGEGSPGTGINRDFFSVRWTGQVQPVYTEAYTFYTVSDDGVRLWVNGQLVINNWTNHAAKEDVSAPIMLQAGQKYDIVLEYYESQRNTAMRLLWSSPSQPKQIIPQYQLFVTD